MNIFVLDYNPQVAAEYHCDKHVAKMILESAQILCAVHHKNGNSDVPYKLTHANHPCTIWAGESKQNYLWLTELAEALNDEYIFRFKYTDTYTKVDNHKSYDVIAELPPIDLPDIGLTKFAEAMPDYCKISEDTVINYREYYRKEKAHILKYTNAQTPYWINREVYNENN